MNIAHILIDLCGQASKLILKIKKKFFPVKYWDEWVIQQLVICFGSSVSGGVGDP